MKTNGLIILLFSSLFLLNSCENSIENYDFLQKEWRVESITNGSTHLTVPTDPNLGEDGYILKFINNLSFYLATSVNYTISDYKITSDGHFVVDDHLAWTKIYNELEHQRNFDEQLVSVFNGSMSYSHTKDKLIFKGENKEVVFSKK